MTTTTTTHKLHPLWSGFTYFPHQVEGIEWMLEKEREGTWVPLRDGKTEVCVRGGLQCDDMGLGKTIQTMAVITNHIVPDTLILAPLAMVDTWINISMKSGLSVYELDASSCTWQLKHDNDPCIPGRFLRGKCRPAVYVTNYEKMLRMQHLFTRKWGRIIMDEAHKIRNPGSQLSIMTRRLKGGFRWALTGTPLVNSYVDVLSLLAFVGVPYLNTWAWDSFYEQILPHLLIHRSLNSLRSVIKGAPPIPTIIDEVLPFTTTEEESFYHGIQDAALTATYASEALHTFAKFKLLLRLRQLSVHPQIYIQAKRRENSYYPRGDWKGTSTKLDAIGRILREDATVDTKEGPHKYIIFCQFSDEMKLIRKYLTEEKIVDDHHILEYDGSLTQQERATVLAKSKALQETTVLLLQLQAGGVGLNLQEYDRILFVSPWWTSSLRDQAIARAVRMGQTRHVKVWHLRLAAENDKSINIDSFMHSKASEKQAMLEKIYLMCENHKGDSIESA